MGIRFKAVRKGLDFISLTEYSIKDVKFDSEKDIDLDPRINDVTRIVTIKGVINFDGLNNPKIPKLGDDGEQILDEHNTPQYESREIDSVRKLANWSIVPEYLDCFCDVDIKMTDSRGVLVKERFYENLFIADYREKFDDALGHGQFIATISERENGPVSIDSI